MSIYQDLILDHYRNPRNQKPVIAPTHQAVAHNPTCGDKLGMELRIEDNIIREIGFIGSGCAISQASASLLTEHTKGMLVEEALALDPEKTLQLLGVTLSPARLKCALLSLETLKKALHQHKNPPENLSTSQLPKK
jgi:nitrogen fixation protein NifU and related proteins